MNKYEVVLEELGTVVVRADSFFTVGSSTTFYVKDECSGVFQQPPEAVAFYRSVVSVRKVEDE